jgi:peptidoglycan/LPS O-acetylase OafA/YrhL
MSKIYFPNLNGLRFIAALLVVIHHVEQFRKILGRPNYFDNPFIKITGKIGVILFFVLSGFLITYLLIKEQQE